MKAYFCHFETIKPNTVEKCTGYYRFGFNGKENGPDNVSWQSAIKNVSTSGTSIGSETYSVNSGIKYTFRVDVKSINSGHAGQLQVETMGGGLVTSQILNIGSNAITLTASAGSMNLKLVKNSDSGSNTTIVFDNTSLHEAYTTYETGLLSQVDYYSSGMEMPARTSDPENYRFPLNGQKNDNELYIYNPYT